MIRAVFAVWSVALSFSVLGNASTTFAQETSTEEVLPATHQLPVWAQIVLDEELGLGPNENGMMALNLVTWTGSANPANHVLLNPSALVCGKNGIPKPSILIDKYGQPEQKAPLPATDDRPAGEAWGWGPIYVAVVKGDRQSEIFGTGFREDLVYAAFGSGSKGDVRTRIEEYLTAKESASKPH